MENIRNETVIKSIDAKLRAYENIYSDLLESDEYSEETRKQLELKYRHYMECLHELNRDFFFINSPVFDTLTQNYDKHDTEFIFLDDSTYTVHKEDIVSVKDDYLLIHNKEEAEANPTVIPNTMEAINLGNVKLIKTCK